MNKLIMAIAAACAAFSLSAADAVFKKASPVWFTDKDALSKVKTVNIGKWMGLDEMQTFIRVASDRPVKFHFSWKYVGWIPGDGKAHDFPIIAGKDAHECKLECAADATYIIAEAYKEDGTVIGMTTVDPAQQHLTLRSWFTKQVPDPDKPGKTKGENVPYQVVQKGPFQLAEGFACKPTLVPFKSSTGKHWLYQLESGKPVTFKGPAKVKGIPNAGIYCNEPGTLVIKWGDKADQQVKIEKEKEGYAGFTVIDPVEFDHLDFIVEKGQFEVNGVGAMTFIDADLALCSLSTSDAKLNAEFAAAKAANDRAKAIDMIKKALGVTKIDMEKKLFYFDPTVKNGLAFVGGKLCVGVDEDGVIDYRWMREGTEGMATDSGKLPEGWKVIRDFDMQAECQRLVDEAIADGLQGGIQFCAYKDGKCIVNVCGGKLTKGGKPVQKDSLFPIFSTEKTLLSTACHRAVEQGKMDYDKPLCTWWPELDERGFFAKMFNMDSDTKKERLTLRETLGYRTCMPGGAPGQKGNPVCDHAMSDKELCDWDKVCRTAAADKPYGVPGTKQAYLPYAYAWMIGHPLEVAMGKPLNQVLTEEVLTPAGIDKDFYFVIPKSEYPRMADFYYGAFCEVMNNDWARQAILPSAWAACSAEALCKFYNRLCGFDGKEPLIKKETLDAALKPCRHESDPLPNAKSMKRDWFMLFGMGYGLWGSAERMDRVFGHGGAGGSEGLVDRDNQLIVGYTCNYCKNCTQIRDKLYEVVGMRWRYWNDNVNIQDLQMTTNQGGTFGSGITSH